MLEQALPDEPDPRANSGDVNILFVGDVVGGIGRRTLLDSLPILRERYAPTFVVVNAENSAGGLGITPKIADELLAAGVDAITLGNHTYHRREIYAYLESEPRIVRPANFLRSQPGHGTCVVEPGIVLDELNRQLGDHQRHPLVLSRSRSSRKGRRLLRTGRIAARGSRAWLT